MLLKYCRCGAIIPADRQRCARCEQLHQSRHTAYNAQCRSKEAHASHTTITAAYKRSPASMRATQRKLLELRKRYFESKGGYEKVLERAGLVAPP